MPFNVQKRRSKSGKNGLENQQPCEDVANVADGRVKSKAEINATNSDSVPAYVSDVPRFEPVIQHYCSPTTANGEDVTFIKPIRRCSSAIEDLFCTQRIPTATDSNNSDQLPPNRPTLDELFCTELTVDGTPQATAAISQHHLSVSQHVRNQFRKNVRHIAEVSCQPFHNLHRHATRNRVRSSPGSLTYPRQASPSVKDQSTTVAVAGDETAPVFRVETCANSGISPDIVLTDLDDDAA